MQQPLGAALERRFVLLQAPAGFGKTTVLADFSRRKREEGLVVAWVSLDAGDVPSVFGGYLACAFERGGLDLPALSDADARPSSPETYEVCPPIESCSAPPLTESGINENNPTVATRLTPITTPLMLWTHAKTTSC